MAKRETKRMTIQEVEEWNELYEYVRSNLLGYDSNQSLSREMVLRLKGLLTNQPFYNRTTNETANYSYSVITNTFKYCSPQITKAFRTISFKDEMHKFNYMLKVVENNINTVYIKMKNSEKAKVTTENVDVDVAIHKGAEYQRKTSSTSDKLNDLW